MRVRVVLLAALAVWIVSCDRGPGRLSAEEFGDRANEACAVANRLVGESTAVSASDSVEAVDSIEEITRIQRDLRDELGTLRPPGDAEVTYDEWMGELDAALGAAQDLAAAMRTGDPAAQRAANETGSAAAGRADRAATALGATACVAGDTTGEIP